MFHENIRIYSVLKSKNFSVKSLTYVLASALFCAKIQILYYFQKKLCIFKKGINQVFFNILLGLYPILITEKVIGPLALASRVLWIRVCPSVLPYFYPGRSFLGIGSLVFSESQHCIRGLCGVVRDRGRFFGKKITPKMGKWVKNKVFWTYWKI